MSTLCLHVLQTTGKIRALKLSVRKCSAFLDVRLDIADGALHMIGRRRCLSVFKRFSASLPLSDVLKGKWVQISLMGTEAGSK